MTQERSILPHRLFPALLATAIVPVVPSLCTADEETASRELIAAWERREHSVSTFVVEWEGLKTIGKGSRSQGILRGNASLLPPTDEEFSYKSRLLVGNETLRYEKHDKEWSRRLGRMAPRVYVSVGNGGKNKVLDNCSDDIPYAWVRPPKSPPETTSVSIAPLMMAFRGGTYAKKTLDIAKYERSKDDDVVDRTRNYFAYTKKVSATKHSLLRVSPSQDWVPVLYETIEISKEGRRQVLWHLDIKYGRQSDGSWNPATWNIVTRSGDGSLIEKTEGAVTTIVLNKLIPESEFDIQFPPGTWVNDSSGSTRVEYVVKSNGEPGKAISSSLDPSYDELKSERRTNWSSRRLLMAVLPITLIAITLGLVWRFRRQRRQSKADSETPKTDASHRQ